MEEEKEIIDLPFEYEDNIERVWFWIRDAKLLNLISSKKSTPLIITKGNDTWTEGNEFEGEHGVLSKYKAKCTQMESLPFCKTLKWEFYFIDFKQTMTQYLSLYKVTENDRTVFLWRIEIPNSLKQQFPEEDQLRQYKCECFELLYNVEKILKESSINLYQYEGGVIKAPMKVVWDFLTEPNSISKVTTKFTITIESNSSLHVGGIIKINKTNDEYYLANITKVDCRPTSNKWVVGFEVFEAKPKIPCQETTLTIMKINANESHLAFFHEFREPASSEKLQELSKRKIYLLEKIKNYLEKGNVNIDINSKINPDNK